MATREDFEAIESGMKVPLNLGGRENWTCPFCEQTVTYVEGRPEVPPGFFQTCQLKDEIVGDECVAHRDIDAATRIIAKRQ